MKSPTVHDASRLVSRLLISSIFLAAGLGKLRDREATAGYMKAYKIPLIPVSLPLAALTELGGGLSVLLGARSRIGALALASFLIPTTGIFHRFWELEGQERQQQQINFLKNLAIIGGLVEIVAHGSGRLSLTRPESDQLPVFADEGRSELTQAA